MQKKIKISAVSYLNTLPFIFGLQNNEFICKNAEIIRDYPALCADKLRQKQVDIGLIPAAELLKIPEAKIISDFCIGAGGKVHTVMIFSEVPISEIDSIYLDYQSRTSVLLLKILMKQYFKHTPAFLESSPGYENQIQGQTAALIIGDRAFAHLHKHKYAFDLSEEWTKYTGLPFVFAVWVAQSNFSEQFLEQFNASLKFGLQNIDTIVHEYQKKHPNSDINLKKYLTESISYDLSPEKRKGLSLFLQEIKNLEL